MPFLFYDMLASDITKEIAVEYWHRFLNSKNTILSVNTSNGRITFKIESLNRKYTMLLFRSTDMDRLNPYNITLLNSYQIYISPAEGDELVSIFNKKRDEINFDELNNYLNS